MQSPLVEKSTINQRAAELLARPGRTTSPTGPYTGEFGAIALEAITAANGLWLTTAEIVEITGIKLNSQNAQKYLERLVTAGKVERTQASVRGRHWWRAVTPATKEVGP